MHLDDGTEPTDYIKLIGSKRIFLISMFIVLLLLIVLSISFGAVNISLIDVIKTLFGFSVSKRIDIIIYNIRLPQILTAVLAGAGLSVSGVVMQSVLKNPLGSPFTLGISHAAAFGAAFSVMILGSGTLASTISDSVTIYDPYLTTFSAFTFSMIATVIILIVSKFRQGRFDVMILAGVALGSLFTAGTMLLQFFADDVQLSAMVFWTFGDVGRTGWHEVIFLSLVVSAAIVFFIINAWNYNALEAGDDTAKGVGVRTEKTRFLGMVVSSFVTAVIISFIGIIGFVGLVAPHIVRRIIGDDYRFLIPGSIIFGSILLLLSDMIAKFILSPHVLPVSILTAFIGAPVFIFLIIGSGKK